MFSNLFKDSASSSSRQQTDNKETSLETILPTPALRTELALLILLCTDAICHNLNATFQVPSTLTRAAGGELIALDGRQKAHAASSAERAERVNRIKRELATQEVQDLHRSALTFYNSWRIGVLKRVEEVLNVKSEAVRCAQEERAAQARCRQEEDLLSQDSQTPVARSTPSSLPDPIPTTLTRLPEESRALILHSILLLLLSLQNYPAQSRQLLVHLCVSLSLPPALLSENESVVANALLASARQLSAHDETARAASSNATARKWKVGLATVAGAALIGVTGGLAAPLLAAGLGTVMGGLGLGATAVGGLLGGLAGSSVLVGGIFGAYGGRMTGKMMDTFARDVEDFRFIAVRGGDDGGVVGRQRRAHGKASEAAASKGHRLRVAIAISGWLTDSTDIVAPWFILGPQLETFALRWEVEALLNLGTSLSAVLKSAAWNYAKLEIVKHTVLGSLAAGLWPLMLLRVSRIVDNPFSVAKSRSDKAGAVLADALVNKVQGERPVTLIGYSLGARVIYSCLQHLAVRRAFGLVESVILMGAPTPSDTADWRKIRAVVSGRVVNVHSSNDYILGFLYRTSSVQLGVAGLEEVQGVQGVENIDVSALVDGHNRYRWLTGTILKKIGMEELDEIEVQMEEQELRLVEEKDRKAKNESEKRVQNMVNQAGEGQEERRIIVEDMVEEEAKILEMQVGFEPRNLAAEKREDTNVGRGGPVPLIGTLRLNDDQHSGEPEEQSPALPPRPSQPSMRRKSIGDAPKQSPQEEAPPKPPRLAAAKEMHEGPPPKPRRATAVAGGSIASREFHVEERDDDHYSAEDVDRVPSASPAGMMMLAPEAEPLSDSEPEMEPKMTRKQTMYSALD